MSKSAADDHNPPGGDNEPRKKNGETRTFETGGGGGGGLHDVASLMASLMTAANATRSTAGSAEDITASPTSTTTHSDNNNAHDTDYVFYHRNNNNNNNNNNANPRTETTSMNPTAGSFAAVVTPSSYNGGPNNTSASSSSPSFYWGGGGGSSGRASRQQRQPNYTTRRSSSASNSSSSLAYSIDESSSLSPRTTHNVSSSPNSPPQVDDAQQQDNDGNNSDDNFPRKRHRIIVPSSSRENQCQQQHQQEQRWPQQHQHQHQQQGYISSPSTLDDDDDDETLPPPSPVSTPPMMRHKSLAVEAENVHHHHHPPAAVASADPPAAASAATAPHLTIPSLLPSNNVSDDKKPSPPEEMRTPRRDRRSRRSSTRKKSDSNKDDTDAVTNDKAVHDAVDDAPQPPYLVHNNSRDARLHLWQLSELRRQGFPFGLALEVGGTRTAYPYRFWVVDNSGSMLTPDGHKVHFPRQQRRASTSLVVNQHQQQQTPQDRASIARCNRWAELQQAVDDHAALAGLIQATTVFRLLNPPGARVGPQELAVADPVTLRETRRELQKASALKRFLRHPVPTADAATTTQPPDESATALLRRSIERDVDSAVQLVRATQPAGATPLTPQLLEFRRRVQSMERRLLRDGQQAVLVLATDGLPTNVRGDETEDAQEEFVDALKSLRNLPVWIVIRMCTDDRKVVEYYNNLDMMLELPLEVIDDFLSEVKEVAAVNPWLNYALPMHRCREMGYHHRIFDLLDERLLTRDELHEFLIILFGKKAMREAPDIHSQWNDYYDFLSCLNRAEGKLWRAQSRKPEHWIDMRRLNKLYGTGRGFSRRGSFPKIPSPWRRGAGDRTSYQREEL